VLGKVLNKILPIMPLGMFRWRTGYENASR